MNSERDEVINVEVPEEEEIKFKPGSTMDKIVKKENAEKNSKFGSVPDKLVRDLTSDERALLIKNFSENVVNDNFNVKQLKNGNISITRKRSGKVKTLNDDIVKNAVGGTSGKNNVMTNEQMLLQKYIDMEVKLEKERMKRKGLKRKYRKMKSDIYENVDDKNGGEIIIENDNGEDGGKNDVKEEVKKIEEPKVESVEKEVENNVVEQNYKDEMPAIRRKLTLRETLLLNRRTFN